MEKLQMTGTDLTVTTIGLGSTQIGSGTDEATSFAILDRYLAAGGSLIDTAHVYGADSSADESKSEATIGRWMADRGVRDRIVLTTKGGHPDNDFAHGIIGKPRLHAEELAHDLAMSLASLRTDVIDLYLMHRDDPGIPVGEILDFLEDQVKAGKIRYYGCSNWQIPRMQKAMAYAKAHGLTGFVANQVAGGLAKLDEEITGRTDMVSLDPEMIRFHKENGMTVMSYMTMNNGYFQKRIQGKEIAPLIQMFYRDPVNEKILAKLTEMHRQGISLTSVMYHYAMHYGIPTIALFGFSGVAQLEDLLAAIEQPVPEEDLAELYDIRWGV